MLKERVAVVEGLAADHTLRRTVESLSERQTSTVTDLTGRVGTLEARTESIASSTTKSAQDTEKRLAALEDGSLKAVVDRRFDTLQEELSRLRESTQASAVRERLAASIDRLQKLEERALAAEHSHAVADERYSVLVGDVADLDKRLQAAGQDIKSCESSTLRVAQDVEKTISRLEEKSAALTKVATETANLKDQVYSLNDLMHDTRGWVQRVSEKSERDDREISHQVRTLDTKSERDDEALRSRVRAFDKKHLVRLEATDKQVARLEDDLRSLQTARSAEPAPRKNGIADDVHRLRHSIEENEPDNAARRELSDLFRAVWEHGFTSTRKRPRISDDDEQQGQNATAPRTEASATVGGRVSAGQRVDASEEPTVGGHAEDGDQAIEATTATNQPAAKRRRLDGDEQAGSEERLQPTTLDGEESEHEDSTPRRSHRSNKGRNERLDDEAFGLISGRNWRVKMFRKYQKRPRQTVG